MDKVRGGLLVVLCAAILAGCLGVSVNKKTVNEPQTAAERAAEDAPGNGNGTVSVLGDFLLWQDDGVGLNANLAYVNHSSRTLSAVDVWCRAYDSDDFQVGAGRWTITADKYGPMDPGFKTRHTIGFRVLDRDSVDRVTCEVTSAD